MKILSKKQAANNLAVYQQFNESHFTLLYSIHLFMTIKCTSL